MTEDTTKDTATTSALEAVEEKTSGAPTPEEAKKEETAERTSSGGKEVYEVPKEFQKFIEQIEKMTVLELHEFVGVLEKRFGVSAQAVAVAAPGSAGGDTGAAEEQDSFKVELKDIGGQKIAVIKVVKEILSLGLKDAKDLVDSAPAVIKEGVKKEEAEEIKAKIEGAGGKVELK